jgi:hypothetical protein
VPPARGANNPTAPPAKPAANLGLPDQTDEISQFFSSLLVTDREGFSLTAWMGATWSGVMNCLP